MTTGNPYERTFRRLLTKESGTDASSPAIAAAARKIAERLAVELAPVIGDAGVAAIYDRSRRITLRRFPELQTGSGSHDGELLARVLSALESHEPALAAEAAVALLTAATELLALFIGEGVTSRLLHDAWPDDFADVAVRRSRPHD